MQPIEQALQLPAKFTKNPVRHYLQTVRFVQDKQFGIAREQAMHSEGSGIGDGGFLEGHSTSSRSIDFGNKLE